MDSEPDDIFAYCSVNQKSFRDFGFPLSLFNQQSYIWQYKLIQSMNERGLTLGMLVRAGLNDLVSKYLETHSVEQDDITTLQYLRNYIYSQYDPEEYYGNNSYFNWIKEGD